MTVPGTPALSPEQLKVLLTLAARYVWWKTPTEATKYPQRVMAQVMNIGTHEDVMLLTDAVGTDILLQVLRAAEAGQFSPPSWGYWHYRLGLANGPAEVPAMPPRLPRSVDEEHP